MEGHGPTAPGLGCGDLITAADGTKTGRSCWLVAIPRGAADAGSSQTNQSGLFWDQWKHRIAVKLDFRPIGDVCAIGAAERQLQGSELIVENLEHEPRIQFRVVDMARLQLPVAVVLDQVVIGVARKGQRIEP